MKRIRYLRIEIGRNNECKVYTYPGRFLFSFYLDKQPIRENIFQKGTAWIKLSPDIQRQVLDTVSEITAIINPKILPISIEKWL